MADTSGQALIRGINIDKNKFSSLHDYEILRQTIIDDMMKIEDNGKKIMMWVKRREDIYEGDNLQNYPEIVYHMDNDYGVDRGYYGKRLFGISAFHEVVSGGHRFKGVIMGNRYDIKTVKSVKNIKKYVTGIVNSESV